jgi:hypothetical protein
MGMSRQAAGPGFDSVLRLDHAEIAALNDHLASLSFHRQRWDLGPTV